MNFEILRQNIEDATKKAFIEIFEKYGADEIYGFALYSDEGAMTVCPSTNTLKHLTTVDQDDLTYHKFEPAEWKYEGIGADKEIEEICTQLREELDENEYLENDEYNEEWFIKFQSELYETCISVLEKLKKEISSQEEENESLSMQIDELASIDNIFNVAKEYGLSYNNSSILQVK